MTPYYEDEWATLYWDDARAIIDEIPSESVDCVVTDPPYGAGWQSNTRGDRFARIQGDDTTGEARDLLSSLVGDIVRVTRRTRHLYSFGLPLAHPLLAVKAELVWDKGRIGSGDLTCQWGPSHEDIFFHIRAADKTNAERGSGALAARLRRGSIIAVRRLSANQVNRHPTEKPVLLMRQLIESSSTPGEIIFDPFSGSGSTLVAATLEGRRSIGIEVDESYAEIAAKRLEKASLLTHSLVGI